MANYYKFLEWDSNFFGYKVMKVTKHLKSSNELSAILKHQKKHQIHLTYLTSSVKITNSNSLFKLILVDKKTTFYKKITTTQPSLIETFSYLHKQPNKQLIDLAIESGVYSRFNIDPNISHSKFQELYKLWLVNSLSGQFAKEILISKIENKISGLITIGASNNKANIGIIAVDKSFRGQGVGKGLINAAENWAAKNKYSSITVTTQGENVVACQFYKSSKFKVIDTHFVYHLWST